MLQKAMDFRSIAIRDTISEVAYGVCGVSAALAGWGVWSLIVATYVHRFTRLLALYRAWPWRPRLVCKVRCAIPLLHFGLPSMGSLLLLQLMANMDYYIVGRYLGTTVLGYYTLAFQMSLYPIQRLIGIVRNVSFPTLSLIQDDIERFEFSIRKIFRSILFLVTPLVAGLIVLSPDFVNFVLGANWQPIIIPMQILALVGLMSSVDILDTSYLALGKPFLRFILVGLRASVFLICVYSFGLDHGVVGITASLMISAILTSLFNIRLFNFYVNTDLKLLVKYFSSSIVAVMVMVIFGHILRRFFFLV
jgi:PST family polysaccharide transporter